MLLRTLIVTVVACAAIQPAWAQDRQAEELRTFIDLIQSESGDATTTATDIDVRRLIEAVLMVRLQSRLQLSDDQTDALVLRVGSYRDRLTAMKFMRAASRENLARRLDQGVTEEEIGATLESLLSQEEDIAAVMHEMVKEAAKDLTAPQTAKLYLFVGEFETFMRDLVYRAQYISLHGTPPDEIVPAGAGTSNDPVIRALVERERAGTTTQDTDMVALFDGLLMARLSGALKLDAEETIKLFHRVGSYKDQLHEIKWNIGSARQELYDALGENAPDPAIETKLEDLLLQERAAADLLRRMVTEAQKDVSLQKSARLYLFVEDFEEYVSRLLEKAQGLNEQSSTRVVRRVEP